MSEDDSQANIITETITSKVGVYVWPITLVAIVALLWFGYDKWMYDAKHVYTDNAQIQGRIVKVFSSENGFLEKLYVDDNTPVKAGEILAQLSNSYYKLEVDHAQAEYNQLLSKQGSDKETGLLQAELESAKANLGVLQSQLDALQTQAQNAQQQDDDTNPQTVDSVYSNQIHTLEKRKYAAEQQVREAEANMRLVSYNLDAARAALNQAKLRLKYTSMKSPIDGVVAQRVAEEGVLVEPGQFLLSVVSLSDTWVVANIKESDFLNVQPGDPVTITVDAYPGKQFQGVVESLSPATGSTFALIPKDNASGNFIKVAALIPVRIGFINDPQKDYKLLPGMSAEVSIQSSIKATGAPPNAEEKMDKQKVAEREKAKKKTKENEKQKDKTEKSDSDKTKKNKAHTPIHRKSYESKTNRRQQTYQC